MLERGEGKQPGAADVLYLSLQVFPIDVFNNTHPPKPLARSLARSRSLSLGGNDDHYSNNSN